MTLAEIKAAVDAGRAVYWVNVGYHVIRDGLGQYMILYEPNGHCIGLTNRAGDKLNGDESQFFAL